MIIVGVIELSGGISLISGGAYGRVIGILIVYGEEVRGANLVLSSPEVRPGAHHRQLRGCPGWRASGEADRDERIQAPRPRHPTRSLDVADRDQVLDGLIERKGEGVRCP